MRSKTALYTGPGNLDLPRSDNQRGKSIESKSEAATGNTLRTTATADSGVMCVQAPRSTGDIVVSSDVLSAIRRIRNHTCTYSCTHIFLYKCVCVCVHTIIYTWVTGPSTPPFHPNHPRICPQPHMMSNSDTPATPIFGESNPRYFCTGNKPAPPSAPHAPLCELQKQWFTSSSFRSYRSSP